MQRPLRVLAAAALLGSLYLVALAPGTMAGTQAAPEVTDAPWDVSTSPGDAPLCVEAGARCAAGGGLDVTAAWVDNETASQIEFHMSSTATGIGPSSSSVYTYNFHFKVAGTDYVATAVLAPTQTPIGSGGVTPGGVAASATLSADAVLSMVVPRASIGTPAVGALITDMFVENLGNPLGQTSDAYKDLGPDTGVATATYTFTMGAGAPPPAAGDSDGDHLNDTWEQSHFGNLNENATGDGDKDGCNNACEQQAKSDPKKADTDGDGCSDGNEIKGGTDPTDPAKKPTDCAPSTQTSSTSGPPTTGPTTTGGPTSTGSTTSNEPDQGEDSGSASERLQEGFKEGVFGVGYLIIACALAGVVILLALIGRGGRWGL